MQWKEEVIDIVITVTPGMHTVCLRSSSYLLRSETNGILDT
jgi:hypothetical protein